ncbi:RNA-directed DNA polymerase, eukaryota, partial [Tanacetum coccineum]
VVVLVRDMEALGTGLGLNRSDLHVRNFRSDFVFSQTEMTEIKKETNVVSEFLTNLKVVGSGLDEGKGSPYIPVEAKDKNTLPVRPTLVLNRKKIAPFVLRDVWCLIYGVVSSEQNGKQSEDPFNIYSLLNKDKMKNNKEANTKESLEYPPGFTPRENDVENVEMDNQKDNCDGEFGNVNNISDEVNFSSGFNTYKKAGGESMDSDHCRESEGSRKGGSILMLMDELVKVGQTMGYNMDGCMKNIEEIIESQGVDGVNFLTLQETKMESIDLFEIKRCWGNFAFDYVHSASVGKSGGILCVWDPNAFKKLNSTASDYFVMIQGNWVSNGKLLLIISVYAPQELSEKKSLWDYLCHVIDNWKGSVIIMGDFNEVRNKNERFGTIFNVHGANAFNSFISMANLEEVPLGGCSFTWCHRSASKMSKLDRFLMSESLLSECPNLSAITLDRFLSDHRPILLRESTHDYGPIPFRFFHYWLEMEGFENFVNEVWREAPVDNSNAMINMMNKLKYLKKKIRVWNGMRQSPKTRKHVLKQELADLEMIIDKGDASSDTLHKRAEVVKSIQEVDKLCAMEASQKAKIKWAIEGDENSKYYHGILNKKRNQLSIRGVLVEGDWVENPNMVKNEFLNHFKNRFDRPKSVRPMLNMEFPHHLNSMQQLDLEAEVSNEEIKKAVWDCGVDKSPGPDGFTFGFYKRFWSLIEKDVLAAVKYFFHYSRIPKGCNSSFIALIPKTPEAKMVKDFRPISLIGSLYKIIAKILANRLVVVLGDIVNEVQSAFVADRQILDGPFILNEVLQWCKLKKKHSFILKIDFEKAYDSVRWDYLDDVLRKFGFGEKWCGWIQECLRSSWGSVLVNGSPTEEFSLSINLSKSKLLGVVVSEDRVVQAANKIGCGVLKAPFEWGVGYPRLLCDGCEEMSMGLLNSHKRIDLVCLSVLLEAEWEQVKWTDLTTYVEGVVLVVTPDRWLGYWVGSGDAMGGFSALVQLIGRISYLKKKWTVLIQVVENNCNQLTQRRGSSKSLMALLTNDGFVAKACHVHSVDVGGKLIIGHPDYGPMPIGKAQTST